MSRSLTAAEVNSVRDAIRDAINRAHSAKLKDRVWTLTIAQAMTRLGLNFGLEVRGARPQSNPSYWDMGWLWDLCWVESASHHTLLDLPLVLESEWNPDPEEILWDFQKLLVSRASLRVMVFEAPDAEVHIV